VSGGTDITGMGTGTMTVPAPGEVRAGDLLLISVEATAGGKIMPPTGWRVLSALDNAFFLAHQVGPGEGDYDFAIGGGTFFWQLLQFRGAGSMGALQALIEYTSLSVPSLPAESDGNQLVVLLDVFIPPAGLCTAPGGTSIVASSAAWIGFGGAGPLTGPTGERPSTAEGCRRRWVCPCSPSSWRPDPNRDLLRRHEKGRIGWQP
jgi:hypothetical protein